jgi:hypothetical protein
LLGYPETLYQNEMLRYSGNAGGKNGHEFSVTGASGGWNIFYAKIAVEGVMWMWFTGTHEQSQMSRWARRSILYQQPELEQQINKYHAKWIWGTWVNEVKGVNGSVQGSDVRLTWTPTSGADHYVIYRGLSPDSLTVVNSGASGASFTDQGLPGGATYHYSVQAVDQKGNVGSRSDTVQVNF